MTLLHSAQSSEQNRNEQYFVPDLKNNDFQVPATQHYTPVAMDQDVMTITAQSSYDPFLPSTSTAVQDEQLDLASALAASIRPSDFDLDDYVDFDPYDMGNPVTGEELKEYLDSLYKEG